MGQVTFGIEHLDGVPTAEMVSQVYRHRRRNRHVLCGLNYTTGDFHESEHSPEIATEDDFGNKQRNVRSHIEERPAEFLNGSRNIGADGERSESVDPGLVIGFHCSEDSVNFALFEPAVVVAVVEKPERNVEMRMEETMD